MDIQKLEKLGELRDKGALTQEEFEAEKKKILSNEDDTPDTNDDEIDFDEECEDSDEIGELSFGNKMYDFWHNYGMKIFIGLIIFIFVVIGRDLNEGQFIVLLIIASIVGTLIKSYQKTSKVVKDLHRYKSINEVISRYGTPDDIQKYGDYTKYTFKKTTNGWGWCKYQTDIFTMQKGKIIKHENYYE